MAEANDDLRVRVTIDREMPDLYERFAGTKRTAREVVHLLRMGLQWEKALSGQLPLFASTSNAASQHAQAPSAKEEVKPKAELKQDIMLGADFVAMSGIDANYFSGAPPVYAD